MFYNDDETYQRLGIKYYSQKLESYGKLLNNNEVLCYDDEAIYLIDRIGLTFRADFTQNKLRGLTKFVKDRSYYFRLDDDIILRYEVTNNNYLHNYRIECANNTIGFLRLQNTANRNLVKIDLANQVLYCVSKAKIISWLMRIAISLDLTFSNVSNFDLARDSSNDYYEKYCNIYYQSTLCPSQVHSIHRSTPKFSSNRKRLCIFHEVDTRNSTYGTIRIGSNKSDSTVTIYSKSNELKTWGEKKNYINQIHQQCFETSSSITRIEVRTESKSISKNGWDLAHLLSPSNHSQIFFMLLGDKLKFKDLTSKIWDKNRNQKFNSFTLISESYWTPSCRLKTVPLKETKQFTHANNTNKIKLMLHMFLDSELTHWGIIDFFRKNIWNQQGFDTIQTDQEISKAVKNYRNPISKQVNKRIKLLNNLTSSKGKSIAVVKCFLAYLF